MDTVHSETHTHTHMDTWIEERTHGYTDRGEDTDKGEDRTCG